MKKRTEKSLWASLALVLAAVLLLGAAPLNAIAEPLADTNSYDGLISAMNAGETCDACGADPCGCDNLAPPPGGEPCAECGENPCECPAPRGGCGEHPCGCITLCGECGYCSEAKCKNEHCECDDCDGEDCECEKEDEDFGNYAISLTAQIALTVAPIKEVSVTLERLVNGTAVASFPLHTGTDGNASWPNLPSPSGTTYRVTVLSPGASHYLSRSSMSEMREFAKWSDYEAVQDASGTLSHHKYVWEYDFPRIPVNNINVSLGFVVNRGEISISKTYGDGVDTNPGYAPWIGIRLSGTQAIEWMRVPADRLVKFTGIADAALARHAVHFDSAGVPQLTGDVHYFLYELAHVDSAPQGFRLVLDRNFYDGRLPAGVPADFELWQSPGTLLFGRGPTDFVIKETVTNNKFDLGHWGNWGVAVGASYRHSAMQGDFYHWDAVKMATNVAQVSPGGNNYLLDRTGYERGGTFEVDYQLEFNRTHGTVPQTVLIIDNATMRFEFDYRAAKGNNNVMGTVFLERLADGVWMPAGGPDASTSFTHNLRDYATVMPNTTDMSMYVEFSLRDDEFILGAQYQVRFEGHFIFSSSGIFDTGEPGTFTKVDVGANAVLSDVREITENEIIKGGSSANWRLMSIADTLQISHDAAIVGVSDVVINGAAVTAGNPATQHLSYSFNNNTLTVDPGSAQQIVLTYKATFTDESWKLAPCAENYTITNGARAHGTVDGIHFDTNDATIQVDIPEYSMLEIENLDQTGIGPDEPIFEAAGGGPFALYEHPFDPNDRIMSGTTSPDGKVVMSRDDDETFATPPAVPLAPVPQLPEPPTEPTQPAAPTTVIETPAVPLAFGDGQSWALWNLMLSIAGAALAVMMGTRTLIKKRRANGECGEQTGTLRDGRRKAEDEKGRRSRLALILAIPLLAIIGIMLFILTQDMRLPMAMADWWTVAHAILFAGGILSYIFAYKKRLKHKA